MGSIRSDEESGTESTTMNEKVLVIIRWPKRVLIPPTRAVGAVRICIYMDASLATHVGNLQSISNDGMSTCEYIYKKNGTINNNQMIQSTTMNEKVLVIIRWPKRVLIPPTRAVGAVRICIHGCQSGY